MAERRRIDRLKTTRGGLLFTDARRGVLACALRDVSDAGVGLRFNDGDVVDPVFKMTADNFRSVRTCQVVWSRGRYVGATFGAEPGNQSPVMLDEMMRGVEGFLKIDRSGRGSP